MNLGDRFQGQTEQELRSLSMIDLDTMQVENQRRAKDAEKFAIATMDEQKTFTEQELLADPLFKEATKVVSMHMGSLIEGDDESIVKTGLQMVSDLTIPTTTFDGQGLLGLYKRAEEAPYEVKQAMWYMIDSVDKKDTTKKGFVRGLKSLGKSPTDLVGLVSSVGYSFFGQKAASSVVKRVMKEALFNSAVTGAYTASDEYLRQNLKEKGYDYEEIAQQAGVGAAFGGVVSVGLPLAAKALGWSGHEVMKNIDDLMQGRKNIDKGVMDQIMTMGQANFGPHEAKVIREAGNEVDFIVNGAKVLATINKDKTLSIDTTQLESGSREGGAVYEKAFDYALEKGYKYKASKDMTPENMIRLPINLLKYRNKVGNDNFTVENIDKRVDGLIKTVNNFVGNRDFVALDKKDLREISKEMSKSQHASANTLVSVSNLEMLQDYLIEKEVKSGK